MAQKSFSNVFSPFNLALIAALLLGVASGLSSLSWLESAAEISSQIFINFLKLLSGPLIFLSVTATIAGMQSFREIKDLGRRVLFYTLFTTIIAALIGLGLFELIQPVQGTAIVFESMTQASSQQSYVDILLGLVPSNLVQVFLENQVVGILLIAVLFGLGILSLPQENKETLQKTFSSLSAAVLKITGGIVYVMPVAVWAFVTLFTKSMSQESSETISSFFLYLSCVLGANLLQGLVVLPLLLKFKKISPLRIAKGMSAALALAFFSRSSNATLPVTLQCAQQNLGISKRVSNFTLPLGSTINMNACASFIFITVIYVAMSNGIVFTFPDLLLWVILATIAAIGNAGVPMGCYFMASAFLASMNVPLTLLGMILPIYAFLDMVETALNVWSNSCMVSIIDKELEEKKSVSGTKNEIAVTS